MYLYTQIHFFGKKLHSNGQTVVHKCGHVKASTYPVVTTGFSPWQQGVEEGQNIYIQVVLLGHFVPFLFRATFFQKHRLHSEPKLRISLRYYFFGKNKVLLSLFYLVCSCQQHLQLISKKKSSSSVNFQVTKMPNYS